MNCSVCDAYLIESFEWKSEPPLCGECWRRKCEKIAKELEEAKGRIAELEQQNKWLREEHQSDLRAFAEISVARADFVIRIHDMEVLLREAREWFKDEGSAGDYMVKKVDAVLFQPGKENQG